MKAGTVPPLLKVLGARYLSGLAVGLANRVRPGRDWAEASKGLANSSASNTRRNSSKGEKTLVDEAIKLPPDSLAAIHGQRKTNCSIVVAYLPFRRITGDAAYQSMPLRHSLFYIFEWYNTK